MYYIYTIEGVNGVYVGATNDPLSRMYSHSTGKDGTTSKLIKNGVFFLRFQFDCMYKARDKEQELMDTLENVVNKNRASIVRCGTRNISLSAKFRPKYVKQYKINMLAGKRPAVLYNKHWVQFSSVKEAEVFIESL